MSGANPVPPVLHTVRTHVPPLVFAGAVLAAGYGIWPGQAESIAKAMHVVAVISWMAGLLYLPRLYVYHSVAERGGEVSETFKVMERRLYHFIMTPAMIVSWVLGLWLAWVSFRFQGVWLWAKLAGVVGLTASHLYLGQALKAFAEDRSNKPQRHWRIINEVPTVLMVAVVIFVVVKPF